MNVISFTRLLIYHYKVLLIIPIVMMIMVFFLIKDAKKDYLTSATIYTGFASGYSVTSSDRPDYTKINIKFDNFFQNIKSRETREEIILKTLAYYLSKDTITTKEMAADNQIDFSLMLSPELLNLVVVKNNEKATYSNLLQNYNQDLDNELNSLLNSSNFFFGLDQLLKLTVKREGSSDIVELEYGTKDAGICYNSARIAIEIILDRVKEIKVSESSSVVHYFLKESEKAKLKLDKAEQELSNHMTQNNIINYYEQTKFISSRRENYETANQEEQLKYSAAKASIAETEKKISAKKSLRLKSQSILDLRNQLGDITFQIAYVEVNGTDRYVQNRDPEDLNMKHKKELHDLNNNKDGTNEVSEKKIIRKLKRKAQNIKRQLEQELESLHSINQTADGIKYNDILDLWLSSVITLEESRARLNQYEIKRREFDITYSRFAKLGSVIKKLERKIGVLERDYLALLSSLNSAKLQQQNIDMATSLKVVDPPFYPIIAQKSKKPLFIILSGILGFILPFGIILILEFLDNTIKTPERAREFSQLYLAGGFPLIVKKEIPKYEELYSLLINQMVSYINFTFHSGAKKIKPFIVIFLSTRKDEGKTQLAQIIANTMRAAGERTLVISPKSIRDKSMLFYLQKDIDNIEYEQPYNFSDISVKDKAISGDRSIEDYRFVFFEIPAIIGCDLPIEIIRNANLSLLTIKSSRNWNEADTLALENYTKIVTHQVSTIINGTQPDVLESIIGEIPKQRSWLRMKIKRFAKRQFKFKRF